MNIFSFIAKAELLCREPHHLFYYKITPRWELDVN